MACEIYSSYDVTLALTTNDYNDSDHFTLVSRKRCWIKKNIFFLNYLYLLKFLEIR